MSAVLPALYAVVRGFIYLGLLLLIGSQCARSLIARTLAGDIEIGQPIRDRARRLTSRLIIPLLLLIILRGALQVLTFMMAGTELDADLVTGLLGTSSWGHAWILQLAAAIVLLMGLQLRATRAATSALPGVVILAALVWAQTGMGHAAIDRWPTPVGRVLDAAHLIGAGIWLGTLGIIAAAALPLLRREYRLPALARLISAFSAYARTGVLLVVASGVAAALVYAGSLDLFLASTWGRLLLVKVACMVGVLVLGWYNWRVVTPALLSADPQGRARLNLAVRIELVLALVMLALTTLLVVSPLPGEG